MRVCYDPAQLIHTTPREQICGNPVGNMTSVIKDAY